MIIEKIDHIGIAVKNLEESLAKWKDIFGIEAREIEEIKERGVKVVHLDLKEGPSIELLFPLEKESPIGKFLEERGEGIHHLCFKVNNIEKAMKEGRAKGIQFIQERPLKGTWGSLITFIHPSYNNGVLLELKEEREFSREPEGSDE